MNASSIVWIYVFRFLSLDDLARAAGTCFAWWSTIKEFQLFEAQEWENLDLSGSGSLYRFIPRRVFRDLTSLNLSSTKVTNRHFLQMIRTAIFLETLDISYCPGISQVSIFRAKENLGDLLHVAISGNRHFTILAVACLCSCSNIATIQAHGLQLHADELLFLRKTFENVERGDVLLETDDDGNQMTLVNAFEEELFQE